VWRITDPQHPNYTEPPQISPVDLREPLPLYLGNSDESTSSMSAIDSPPEYQGRDQVTDNFVAAVAQLLASREPIAPVHTNIEHIMQHGNPLTPDLHIASVVIAITFPAYTPAINRPRGSGGGSGGRDNNGPMQPNDPGDDDGPPGGGGLGRGAGQPAYNLDEHP
jgi:hypothetical protein